MSELSVNMLIKSTDNNHIWRVLWLSGDRSIAYIFDTNTSEMPSAIPYADLQRRIEDESFVVQKSDPYLRIVSENELSEKEQVMRDEIWAFMSSSLVNEPGIYEKKQRGAMMSEVMSKTGKDLKNLHRYLKTYWKYGKTRNAFLPKYSNCGVAGKERGSGESKRGRPRKYNDGIGVNVDDTVKIIFEKAVEKYYHTRKENTLQYAYDMMVKDYYTNFTKQPDGKVKAELVSYDKIPTIGQFRYWYSKKHNVKDRISKRKGETKFNLDHRAIIGKSDHGIMGPGAKYEIDATVGDIYLVSRFNRADIIGRPVIYFLIDVFSRMVTGMYVGLEGPSWAGMMMAIANAASDKGKYCAEHGIQITEDEWPCQGMPGAIRGDRGELESKAADTLVNALGVRVEVAPPFRADMKGIVEQHFNTINDKAVAFLPGHVKPDMKERGGHDYRLDAILDIHQLTQILIQSVLHHNNHHILEGYERTAEMITDNVAPIPVDIWHWGIAHCSGALKSFPEETVKLALMSTSTATVTAKGIKFKGLYYLCERAATEYWFETARAKRSWKVDISYDPRNMNSIYVRNPDGTVDACWLSEWQDKYIGKCLHEIQYLRESEKMLHRKGASKEMASKAELSAAIDGVIKEAEEMARQTAVPKSKLERTKDIRANRAAEKEKNRKEEAFILYGTDDHPPLTLAPEMNNGDEISPDMKMILKDLEERLSGGS
jgi:hypothetical protein